MPIRPEHRWPYPIDWPELLRTIRFGRAKARCEGCGRPHGELVFHLGDGRWWDNAGATWRNRNGRPLKRLPVPGPMTLATRVVLAATRVDHDPTNNCPGNLRALCQRCHILHDREEHGRRRRLTYRMSKAMGDLFAGPYRR